jgi:hypothetical protein
VPVAIPTKDEARDILDPYHEIIWSVVHEAWDECRAVQRMRADAGMAPLLYHRTIANDVFDAIARRAIPAFGMQPRVTVKIEAQTFKILTGGLVARPDKLGRNISTQEALAFMEAAGVLPGMPPETAKVEIVWLPNEIWTQVEAVLVIARDGDQLIWDYEIEDPRASAEIIPLPIRPPEPPAPQAGDLVRPKATPNAQPNKSE